MKERVRGRQRSISFLSLFPFRERPLLAAIYERSLSLKHRTRAIRPYTSGGSPAWIVTISLSGWDERSTPGYLQQFVTISHLDSCFSIILVTFRARNRILKSKSRENKRVQCILLCTESLIIKSTNLLKSRPIWHKNKQQLPCPLIIGTFEKGLPGPSCSEGGQRYPSQGINLNLVKNTIGSWLKSDLCSG